MKNRTGIVASLDEELFSRFDTDCHNERRRILWKSALCISLPARFILLELSEYFLELLLIFQLLAVKTVEPLEYLRIGNEKSAHVDKCTHNQYVCLYSRFTSQKAGKHRYSLLRKDIREISVTASGV